MTWQRAFEADARLAARNAVKIRAALRQSINTDRIAEGYLASLPPTTGNLSQSRARARAWAIMNVRVNLEPLRAALLRTLAEAYVLGTLYAEEQVGLAKARRKSVATGVNWDTWRPGDEAAAILVKPPKAFQTLLGRYGLTLKGFSDTTLNDIGNSLGESLELGLSASQMAKRLGQYVASPSRALSIAVTEQNRAISVATVARYKEMGVEKQEWIASDPCDECEQNDGQVVKVGAPFASGDTEPPVHPNCRCALLPVVVGMEDQQGDAGDVDKEPEPDDTTLVQGVTETITPPLPTQSWTVVDEARWVQRQEAERLRRGLPPSDDLQKRIMAQQVADTRVIYERGSDVVVIGKNLEHITDANIEVFMQNVDEVLARLPEWRRFHPDGTPRNYTFIVDRRPAGNDTLAFTGLGHDTIWVSGKDVVSALPVNADARGVRSGKGWFMPIYEETNPNLYTLAHELGHTVDSHVNEYTRGKVRSKVIRKHRPLFSRYSMKNTRESYAEVFAQWMLGEQNAVTEAYAEAFGWNLSAKEYYETFDKNRQWQPALRPTGVLPDGK